MFAEHDTTTGETWGTCWDCGAVCVQLWLISGAFVCADCYWTRSYCDVCNRNPISCECSG